MRHAFFGGLAALGCAFVLACSDDEDESPGADAGVVDAAMVDPANFPTVRCDDVDAQHCIEIEAGDVLGLQTAANSLEADTALVLGQGTFEMNNQLTIRRSGIQLIGQGMDETTLDFGPARTQVNGVDVVGDDFLVQDLKVLDAPKDGIRVERSDGVVFRRVYSTWSAASDSTNGAYGIYPVRSTRVLVEDSIAENASDAGLYVGQCQHAIVRNNEVRGNVAGLEIENTQYADVYGNHAEDNTAGIVVFDLPGNPIVGRDVRLRDNTIVRNNRSNFAPGGTVAEINAGTGTFAMASRRVEITGNVYEDNRTVDIAILSGLIVEADEGMWALSTDDLVGDWDDLDLLLGEDEDTVTNFRTENILIADNTHEGSGTDPDTESDPNMLGLLLALIYGDEPVSSVLYDTFGESSFSADEPGQNSNDNHLCAGGNTDGTFASMDVPGQLEAPGQPFFIPEAPFSPFDCTELVDGPVEDVELP